MSYLRKDMQELLNSAHRVPENVLLAAAVGAVFAVQTSDVIGGIVDVPSQALGSLVAGSTGTTAGTSIAPIVAVPDTTIDRSYPASYGQLPLANSIGIALNWYTVRFGLTLRST
jgi:hypothetical protein